MGCTVGDQATMGTQVAPISARVPRIGEAVHYASPDRRCYRALVTDIEPLNANIVDLKFADTPVGASPAQREAVIFCANRCPNSWHWPEAH